MNLKEYVKGANLPETWEQVVLAIKSKLHREMYAVGDKFNNIWKNTNNSNKEYDNPLRINHFEDRLELEDGTTVNGMWLQTVYAHLEGVQFSHQQAFYVSDEGMTAGTYCIGFDYTVGNNGYVNKGDYWNFTLTRAFQQEENLQDAMLLQIQTRRTGGFTYIPQTARQSLKQFPL